MIEITSSSNSTIKEVRSLYRRKERWKNKLFIVEGVKMIEECIDRNYHLSYIIYCDDLFQVQGGKELFQKIESSYRLINVPRELYKEISDTENPQGVLAVSKFNVEDVKNIDMDEKPFVLLLDKVQDPGNLGTIIRSADAFGVHGIILTEGCVDIYNPKVVRATMGSIFRVAIYHEENAIETVKSLKEKGMKIFSTSLDESEDLQNVDFKESSMFIIGNESQGVSRPLNDLADKLIRIPMIGEAESLNVAIATSIIMYEAMKGRKG